MPYVLELVEGIKKGICHETSVLESSSYTRKFHARFESMPYQKKTTDGYSWTRATGVRRGGLHCRGVVEPREKNTVPAGHIYDAIVIGAGYAGLMAAREMTDRGRQTQLGLRRQDFCVKDSCLTINRADCPFTRSPRPSGWTHIHY